jgi:two-component system KDP operon response regulator KdpE
VDADELTRRDTVRVLEEARFTTVEAEDGLVALRTIYAERPEAVVTDLRVPGLDGLDLVLVLRAACDIPILVQAPTSDPRITARLLDTGADDVVEKGCASAELVARLRAAIRRYKRQGGEQQSRQTIRTGVLTIDRPSRTVTKRDQLVHLTPTEYRLLEALASRPGQVAPHRFLLSTTWGEAYVDDTHYLRVYMGYLRSKLEDNPAEPRYLLNEWGIGYRLTMLPVEEPIDALDQGNGPRAPDGDAGVDANGGSAVVAREPSGV